MAFEFKPASAEELAARGVMPPVKAETPAEVAPAPVKPAKKTAKKTAS